MAIAISLLILVLGFTFARGLSQGRSTKRKYIVWGTATILIIAPFFSWIVSILFGINQGDGFPAVGLMMLLFPIFFLIGLVTLLLGIFKKESTNEAIQ